MKLAEALREAATARDVMSLVRGDHDGIALVMAISNQCHLDGMSDDGDAFAIAAIAATLDLKESNQ